jgi:hypothetical protein
MMWEKEFQLSKEFSAPLKRGLYHPFYVKNILENFNGLIQK